MLQASNQCKQLQVLFLVDQSGSMSGTGTSAKNDPNNLRFAAPRTAVELLLDKRVRTLPDVDIQVALVHFGDAPKIGFNWQSITATTPTEAQTTLDELSVAFDPVALGQKSLGETNVGRAFQYAASMFSKLPPIVNDCPLRAIILLSDGQPYVSSDTGFSVDKHMARLKADLEQFMPIPPYRLYVVALNDRSGTYWNTMEPYWLGIAGDPNRIGLVTTQQEVGQRFRAIVDDLMAGFPRESLVISPLCTGPVVIPPYLQWVSFTFYKPKATTDHLLVSDDLGMVDATRTDITATVAGLNTAIETLRVENPRPGRWELKTSLPTATCDLELRGISASGFILAPSATLTQTAFTRLPIEFKIGDQRGNLLPIYSDALYELQASASLHWANGNAPIALAGQANTQYAGTFVPLASGLHEIYLDARSHNVDNQEVVVISPTTKIGTFTVLMPDVVLLGGPMSATQSQHRPLTFTLQVMDAMGQPANLEYPPTLNTAVTVNGQPIPIDFKFNAQGAYEWVYVPEQTGPHQFTYSGQVTLPDGSTATFGKHDVMFDVYSASWLGLQFTTPPTGQDFYWSTDVVGRPADARVELQLVYWTDDPQQAKPISPEQVVQGDPTRLLTLKVLDAQGQDVSTQFRLNRTGQIGGYEIVGVGAEAGQYTFSLIPQAPLKPAYVWQMNAWERTLNAFIHPGALGVGAGVLTLTIVLGSAVLGFFLRRQHPGSGRVVIYGLSDSEGERRTAFSEVLGTVNHQVLTQGLFWLWPSLLPLANFSKLPNLIRRVDIITPSESYAREGRVRVRVWGNKGTPSTVELARHVEKELFAGYRIAKDPETD